MNHRDFLRLFLLYAVITILLSPVLFTHQVYFFKDLTYINHPWRVLTTEGLQKGQLPLWNPYAHFGIPLLGNFQTGIFYPPSLIFDCFPFASALGFYQLIIFFLGAGGAYLWLKSLRFPGWACLCGACVFSLGGFSISSLQHPNLLGTLVWWPVLFLFANRLILLTLTFTLALLSGYPTILGGMTAGFFFLRWVYPSISVREMRASYLRMTAAVAGSMILTAAALFPGLELIRHSSRGMHGIESNERMGLSLEPYELTTLISPALTRWWAYRQTFRPTREAMTWDDHGKLRKFDFYIYKKDPMEDIFGSKIAGWKAGYIGISGGLLALLGLASWTRRRIAGAAAIVVYSIVSAVLLLGDNTAVSRWIWENAHALHFIRGSARLSYLWLGAAVPLAAMGAAYIRRFSPIAAIIVLAELANLGWRFYPTMPAEYYWKKGPLVEYLQENIGNSRYFRLPMMEASPILNREDDYAPEYKRFKREVFETYREKLYGISNAPYHFSQGSGGYEPLVPEALDRIADFFIKGERKEVAARMQWGGVKFLLDRRPMQSDGLINRGIHLWLVYETKAAVSRAYWVEASAGKDLEKQFWEIPAKFKAEPLSYFRPREDRFMVTGTAPKEGWLYVSEPYYPGWRVYISGKRANIERAFGAFIRVQIPAGNIDARFVYKPGAWVLGLWLSLLSLAGLAWIGAKETKKAWISGTYLSR